VQLNEKHHITEKVTQGLLNGLDALNKALKDDGQQKQKAHHTVGHNKREL
jgi:hypothetical protein